MNRKEKKAEEQELEKAVCVLRATLRAIAKRKAHRYEQEFLCRVRDMINEEIECNADVTGHYAAHLGKEIENEIVK